MPENIVKKINHAELAADKIIEEARKKALALVGRAREKAEKGVKAFQEEALPRMKAFREEKKAGFGREAEKIRTDGEKAKTEYIKKIEARLPTIKKKVSELIRKELCL